jgi:hypothetical protein
VETDDPLIKKETRHDESILALNDIPKAMHPPTLERR